MSVTFFINILLILCQKIIHKFLRTVSLVWPKRYWHGCLLSFNDVCSYCIML